MKKIYLLITLLLTLASLHTRADITMPHIFGDHMVLQQNSECPIWGFSSPNEQVQIIATWNASAIAVADANGRWETHIKTPSYGGPYDIAVKGKNTVEIHDVLIGEVWLASGQSNMELPLSGWGNSDTVYGGSQAVRECENSKIRFITVQHKASFTEQSDMDGWWSEMRPVMADRISAFAYFYARKIYEETGIPVGIINSSWGGCYGESWVAKDYLKKISEFKQRILDFDNYAPMQQKLTAWITSHPKIVPSDDWYTRYTSMEFHDEECAKLSYDDGKWNVMRLPCYYDDAGNLGTYDGIVWFRRWVDIPASWTGKKLVLSLGPIDDMDETFVNGEKVGANMREGLWNVPRVYTIQPGLVRAGEMLVAVRMIDNGSGGGIYGHASDMKIYPEGREDDAIYIAGNWKYLPTGEYREGIIYQYDYKTREYNNRPKVNVTLNNHTISSLYNAMIHPLMPFKLAGAIWYQGEGNVGRASEYVDVLKQLAQCWRDGFQCPDMKFYYAQIASFDYGEGVPAAELRDAQRRALYEIPNSGMCCLLDLGKKESKHPAYKKEAADRLALWALNDLYNKPCETSGPLFDEFVVYKGKVGISFTHTTGGLVVHGARLTDFEISDAKGNYYPAEAEIVGDMIVVSSDKVPSPKNVRYCWKNYYKTVSLYNGAGLPAPSFTTEKKLSY